MKISKELTEKVLNNFYKQFDDLLLKAKMGKIHECNISHIYYPSFTAEIFDCAVYNHKLKRFIEIQIRVCRGEIVTIEGEGGGHSENVETVIIKIPDEQTKSKKGR